MPYTYRYPRPAVTVDAIVFDRTVEPASVLLIQRANSPFQDHWAFPGGFMDIDETAEEAVRRELQEETGIAGVSLSQLHAFTTVDRDPRARVISIAFHGTLDSASQSPSPADDAKDARWFPLDDLPPLAFDHREMLRKALETI